MSRQRSELPSLSSTSARRPAASFLTNTASGSGRRRLEEGPYTAYDASEGNALRPGGVVSLWSRDYFGLVVQYASVGIIYGALPATVYPFLTNYLNMEGTQITSAKMMLMLPWSLKAFYGILTDCISIGGYRRRPYIVFGWTIAVSVCLVMASMDAGPPYFPLAKYSHMSTIEWTPEIRATFNEHSRTVGSIYIILMMTAAFGYIFAVVATDGIMVSLAQREPQEIRGRTQTASYLVRTIFVTFSNVLVGFTLNSEHYGGTFTFSLSFNNIMLIVGVMCAPAIPMTWFFIREDKHPGHKMKPYLRNFWRILQTRVMYQVIANKFFGGIFENFAVTCNEIVQRNWAGTEPINEKVSVVIGNILYSTTLWATGKFGLAWNWRTMQVVTILTVVVLDSFTSMLTIWDVIRNQWFWLGVPLAEYLPHAIGTIIASYVVVELAEEGSESAMYGLLTSSANIGSPFSSTLAKAVDSHFDITNEDIQSDTLHVRQQVTYAYLVKYGMNIVGLAWVSLLPKQKADAQRIKKTGGSSWWMGLFTALYLIFAIFWALLVNILSILPQTSCLAFAGGRGCSATG
uniref:Transmembrane protein putative n=1 Tax=Albugo laibachii Nc14 TaxID=890382 RepID=F0WT03_9STRA|nr:transmembrane protein putative [Albugo laibachii Nc14]|eukprot:CCA24488.1 transmembrane protein putative [Albugo laibachii Nc14]